MAASSSAGASAKGTKASSITKDTKTQTTKSTSRPGGYTETYTGGNAALDKTLKTYSDQYFAAREAGDAKGMRDANDAANQARNQYGYKAEYANEDIAKVAAKANTTTRSGGGGGSGGVSNNTANTSTAQKPVEFQRVELSRPTDYSSYIEEMNRARQTAALNDLKAAYDKNVAALRRTQEEIAPAYQQARNQTAGNSEQAKRQFAEYAAARGLNSGTGGQAELSRQNTLQTSLNQLNRAEADKLSDLSLQRSQLETDYNNAIAKAKAEGDSQLASQLYQEKVRLDEALRQMQIQQADLDLKTWQANYTAQRDQTADAQYAQQLQLKLAQWQLEQDKWAKEQEQWDKNWQLEQDKWAVEQEQWDKNWQQEQDKWAAEQDQWNKNWQQEQDKWAAEQDHWNKNWEREGEQWDAEQQLKQKELLAEQQKHQDSLDQQAYENQMDAAKYYATYGDLSGFEALGKDTTQMQAWLNEQRALQQAKQTEKTTTKKTSSSSSSTKSSKKSTQKSTQKNTPKSTSTASKTVENKTSLPKFSSYSEAATYLKDQGISAGGLMTQTEWARHKNNKNDTSGASSYPDYQSYLTAFVRYLMR